MGVHPVQVSVHHVDQLLDLLIPLAAIEDGDPGELAQGLVDVVRVHFAAYNGDESLVLGPRVIELLPANRDAIDSGLLKKMTTGAASIAALTSRLHSSDGKISQSTQAFRPRLSRAACRVRTTP
jgi:hypothetical protein